MRIVVRGAVWFGLYIFLILFPLLVGAVFREPGGSPSILIDLAAALGYIGLALMAFELAPQAGHNVTDFVEPFVDRRHMDRHIGMGA